MNGIIPIEWTNSTNIKVFNVDLSFDGRVTWQTLAQNISGSMPPSSLYNAIIPVITQTQNDCYVRVSDALGKGADTSDNSFTIIYNLLGNLNISYNYKEGTETIISWDTTKDSRTQVFYSQDSLNLSSSSIKDNTFQSSHSHLLDNLEPYHLYYYKIRSDTPYELAETTGSFQYIPTPGLAFTGYGLLTVDGNVVTLDWATNQYAYGWVMYGSSSVLNLSTPVYPMSMMQSIVINDLFLNTNYYFQIYAQRPSGSSPDIGFIQSSILTAKTTGDITIISTFINPTSFYTMKSIQKTLMMTTPNFTTAANGTTIPNVDDTTFSISTQPVQKSTASIIYQLPSASIIGTEITYSVV